MFNQNKIVRSAQSALLHKGGISDFGKEATLLQLLTWNGSHSDSTSRYVDFRALDSLYIVLSDADIYPSLLQNLPMPSPIQSSHKSPSLCCTKNADILSFVLSMMLKWNGRSRTELRIFRTRASFTQQY